MTSRSFLPTKVLTLLLATALLGGCAQLGGALSGESSSTAAPAAKEDQPTICLLPNKQLKDEQLVQLQTALSAGIRAAGMNVEVLKADGTADDCDTCLSYAIVVQDKTLKGIQFQIFEDGKPTIAANGAAENGSLQLQRVALYSKALMEHYLKVKADPTAAQAQPAAQPQPAAK